ncbi:MAG: homoserine O-acetyltransferase [Anaerolineae bacterium]|nr:homoserine O-acetyltransferase [Anaerolineae bacterium]
MFVSVETAPTPQTAVSRPHQPGSVGLVRRQYAHFDTPLQLGSGRSLPSFTLAYETYGRLNADRSNAIMICHALSGDAHVAGYHTTTPDEKPGWWDDAVGPGKMFDTNRFFVICSNVLGGCQGSTGPSSLAPDGKPYALRFPLVTVADMVQAQRHLLDQLGIHRLFAITGGSMGAMQALQWAVDFPERVGAVLFLASSPRSSAQHIAFNETGRQAIYADPNWNGGNYYDGPAPAGGLAVARMMAHITYMSEHSLEHKFGRNLQDRDALPYTFAEPEFAVESYLSHQGSKFVQRFDANSYLYITKAIDYFDIGAEHGSLKAAVAHTQCPFLVVSFSSDWLYTAEQARMLVEALEATNCPVEYQHIDAPFGHDSFLVEVDRMTSVVGGYLAHLTRQSDRSGARVGVRYVR